MAENLNSPIDSSLGPFLQNDPIQNDQESDIVPMSDFSYQFDDLPEQPFIQEKTGIVLVPSLRIDGSDSDSPWNIPEPVIWDWLRKSKIIRIDEQQSDGTNGTLWCWAEGLESQEKAFVLKFDTVGSDFIYSTFGDEYQLSPENHDILRREQASYEVAKALGCEDLLPPTAARQTNLVPLVSDEFREHFAEKMGIEPLLVEETFGIIGLAQLVPLNCINFVEYWASLAASQSDRLMRASDAIRYALYRMIILDFVLGTGNRSFSDAVMNRSSGSIAVYGFGATFPNPVISADLYLQKRARGWGRKDPVPTEYPSHAFPATACDTFWMDKNFKDKEKEEFIQTAKQCLRGINEQVVSIVCRSSEEYGVPRDNIAGMLSRIAFLKEDVDFFVGNSSDYMRSVMVPLRRGYSSDSGRTAKIIAMVNQSMTGAFGEEYDFSSMMQGNG